MSGFRNLIVDTGFLIGLISRKDKFHRPCMESFRQHTKNTRYFSIESCLSEACFILGDMRSIGELERLVQTMPLEIVSMSPSDISRSFDLMRKYEDLPMDFADAGLVAVAERLDIDTVLTTDRRDFGVYKPRHTRIFKIEP